MHRVPPVGPHADDPMGAPGTPAKPVAHDPTEGNGTLGTGIRTETVRTGEVDPKFGTEREGTCDEGEIPSDTGTHAVAFWRNAARGTEVNGERASFLRKSGSHRPDAHDDHTEDSCHALKMHGPTLILKDPDTQQADAKVGCNTSRSASANNSSGRGITPTGGRRSLDGDP